MNSDHTLEEGIFFCKNLMSCHLKSRIVSSENDGSDGNDNGNGGGHVLKWHSFSL